VTARLTLPERAAAARERVAGAVAGMPPGSFAMVMATGIVSTAMLLLGQPVISWVLLVVAVLAYLVLCALLAWRLVVYPARVVADTNAPERAFAFFTFVAATDVVGLRLDAAGVRGVAIFLAVVAAAAWVLLSYGIPARLMTERPKPVPLRAVNGTWLIWVVGTQSVASTAATFAPRQPDDVSTLTLVAVGLWAFAVVLYLLLMGVVVSRLVLVELSPQELTPPYWITMGATAITVFAASRILGVPGRLPVDAAAVSDAAFGLWAFGSWWIPLLVVLGVWRHVVRRVPFRYDQALWSMVFPLGMYAAASDAFGRAAGLGALVTIAEVEVWFALAAWLLTFAVMLRAALAPASALR
jgi:tellurite resistance protein TehA-like permease